MYVPKSASPEEAGSDISGKPDLPGSRICQENPKSQPPLNAGTTSTVNQMELNAIGNIVYALNAIMPPQVLSAENLPKNVGDLPKSTWKCELCQDDFDNPSDHVSQQHGISLPEYVHLVTEETEQREPQTHTDTGAYSTESGNHIVTDMQTPNQNSSNCWICEKGLFLNEQYKETHIRTMHGVENREVTFPGSPISREAKSLGSAANEITSQNNLDNLDVKVEDCIGDPLAAANIESFIHIKDGNELPILFLPDD